MGVYLNSKKPYTGYKKVVQSPYFVDKTAMLNELIPMVEHGGDKDADFLPSASQDLRYICITRPR